MSREPVEALAVRYPVVQRLRARNFSTWGLCPAQLPRPGSRYYGTDFRFIGL
jgi:hypothetical protein